MKIFFEGGVLDSQSREWPDDRPLPKYLTFAQAQTAGAAFQLGIVYEKVLDNLGADIHGAGPQAQYRFIGDTGLGRVE